MLSSLDILVNLHLTSQQCEWSMRDGNDTSYWVDAHLTLTGIAQARAARAFWAQQIVHEKIPLPQSYYTSPLDRCLATAQLSFADLALPPDRPFIPSVKEVNILFRCLPFHFEQTLTFYPASPGNQWPAHLRPTQLALLHPRHLSQLQYRARLH